MSEPAVEVRNLSKRFVRSLDFVERVANLVGANYREEVVSAVDRVSLRVDRAEVVGLVGESGCGKSTLGRMLAGILEPDDGEILMGGEHLNRLDDRRRKAALLSTQMVFQNPMASLNPRMRVVDTIGQAPVKHSIVPAREIVPYVDGIMRQVGLDPATRNHYPHQFSGGQRARIGIARALAVKPSVLVCDEATAALDVSIQAQVLNLFMRLRAQLGLTYLFVSHDLGVVRLLADRVGVMYLGRIVEIAPAGRLFADPQHPYTRALLADMPQLVAKKRRFVAIKGQLPSPLNPPMGCHFHPRCPMAVARCRGEAPALREIAGNHSAACHLV
ncbi:ABC transporter ATP-binding protein [Aquamicrobium sp. LC103]|uniref:ABC transporter ATP-binding protein n=1 Tax=Aquamicrobium sp. LC103 TaxID=1120658 RepID=UPI00069C04F3|nr:ABC transporter ATP-binding protein [Aquamicrobium sp. LC103]TKT69893.1 ABC transporter ATP-binding protein [Aquamicrobium sp. LC103]